jgi:hypothetical protein
MVVVETLYVACMSAVRSERGCDELVRSLVCIERDTNCFKVAGSNLKSHEAVKRSSTIVTRHHLPIKDNLWTWEIDRPLGIRQTLPKRGNNAV